MRTVSMVKIPSKSKLNITVGENMKKYIKNITDDNKTIIQELGRPYSPATLSFKEGAKKITLKPGEYEETKLNGSNIDGLRLRLVTEDEVKEKPKKKEVK